METSDIDAEFQVLSTESIKQHFTMPNKRVIAKRRTVGSCPFLEIYCETSDGSFQTANDSFTQEETGSSEIIEISSDSCGNITTEDSGIMGEIQPTLISENSYDGDNELSRYQGTQKQYEDISQDLNDLNLSEICTADSIKYHTNNYPKKQKDMSPVYEINPDDSELHLDDTFEEIKKLLEGGNTKSKISTVTSENNESIKSPSFALPSTTSVKSHIPKMVSLPCSTNGQLIKTKTVKSSPKPNSHFDHIKSPVAMYIKNSTSAAIHKNIYNKKSPFLPPPNINLGKHINKISENISPKKGNSKKLCPVLFKHSNKVQVTVLPGPKIPGKPLVQLNNKIIAHGEKTGKQSAIQTEGLLNEEDLTMMSLNSTSDISYLTIQTDYVK